MYAAKLYWIKCQFFKFTRERPILQYKAIEMNYKEKYIFIETGILNMFKEEDSSNSFLIMAWVLLD